MFRYDENNDQLGVYHYIKGKDLSTPQAGSCNPLADACIFLDHARKFDLLHSASKMAICRVCADWNHRSGDGHSMNDNYWGALTLTESRDAIG